MTVRRTARLIACLIVAGPLAAQEAPSLAERYDLSKRVARYDLPGRLAEVSGLAITQDGRLFAHGDERGWVHEIDAVTGEVGKRFMLGEQTARDDFEGIAIVGERFFLITSRGLLYETREGEDREEMAYRVTDTRLGSGCEIEGLDYHPQWNELLIPCKSTSPDVGAIVIHRLPIEAGVTPPPPILVDRNQLRGFELEPEFHASAIALDPATGTLVLVSGREETIIEVATDGRLLDAIRLSRRRHAQTEGLAFGAGGALFLADESNGQDARLTEYRPAGEGGR